MAKDWNAELFIRLYSKIALALGVTPTDQPVMARDHELYELFEGTAPPRRSFTAGPGQQPQFLLAIYNPGQYIPAGMDPVGNVDDRYSLSVLFDVVPQFSWVLRPASTTVSNAYRSILDNKQVPIVSLTEKQKKALDDARAYYDEHKAAYEEYQEKYLDQLDAYDAAWATEKNGGDKVPSSLKMRLKRAYDQWIASGHKEGVDSAVAVIAKYEALEPDLFWAVLRKRFNDGTQTSSARSNFQLVGFSPPYKSWFGDAGWTKFTFNQKDMDNQSTSQSIGVSGNLDLTFGIFNVSGNGRYDEESTYKKMDQTTLDFSCELMRVSLDRNWMNPLVLSSTAWRWMPGSPLDGSLYSTGGDISGAIAPSGSMTVIPTAAILSRKVQIAGSFDNTVVEEMNRLITANASVGIGPFSIAGQLAMRNHSASQRGTIAANGIEAPDVQIIAMICEVLPRCPNPDNSLTWS